ncbi:MAG TPA: hypothetical protein VE977_00075, partial [Pyrinomonadaceae bacterium]|nr:hypothetical protein [Pyrinomonadaceae bacterium]
LSGQRLAAFRAVRLSLTVNNAIEYEAAPRNFGGVASNYIYLRRKGEAFPHGKRPSRERS